jgi:8-oxo-dGTP pyrophosphatase MutT (NUDIX family)
MKRVVPKLSASLLIVDQSDNEPRFLFGRRHANHVFMPNRYVFPGGRVDRSDANGQLSSALRGGDNAIIEKHLNSRNKRFGPGALALCAVREAWEETGNLIGEPIHDATVETYFPAFMQAGFRPKLSSLRLLARAITPTSLARRYDAWFFIVSRDQIGHSVNVCGPDSELDHQLWASETQTLTFDLPSITRIILREAVERLRVDPNLSQDFSVPNFITRGKKFIRRDMNP